MRHIQTKLQKMTNLNNLAVTTRTFTVQDIY